MIKIISNKTGMEVPYESFIFSGGEVHIKIPYINEESVTLECKLINSNEVFKLLLLTDSLRRMNIDITQVFIPYLPYARQDRVMNDGESLSLKVFCDLINSQKYKRVVICDPHSDVSTALLNNVAIYNVSILSFIIAAYTNKSKTNPILLSPDAGALKKIYKQAKDSGFKGEILNCSKVRDTTTGTITDTIVPLTMDHANKDIIILDDICDGGRTFIEIAKKIKTIFPEFKNKIILGVTHGIFSKGFEPIFESGITNIYCTNTFSNVDFNTKYKNQIHQLNIF